MGPNALEDLVRKARQRFVYRLLIEQMAFSAAVAFGGSILLLLLGTLIFDWRWVGALAAISLLWGFYRAKSKFPSPYSVAQLLDRRLQFNDALSTALYFRLHQDSPQARSSLAERQRLAAEELARTADWKAGIPFGIPRSLYAGAGLALAAIGLLVVRVGVTRSLDLRPSLAQIAYDGLFGNEQIAANLRNPENPKGPRGPAQGTQSPNDPWQAGNPGQNAPQDSHNAQDAQNTAGDKSNSDQKANGAPSKKQDAQPGQNGDEPSQDAADQSPDGQSGQDGAKDGQSSQAGKQADKQDANSGKSGESSSLASKMRDAISNLVSKLKMQASGAKSQPKGSQPQNDSQQAAQQKNSEGGAQGKQDSQTANSQSGQQGEQNGQNSQNGSSTAQAKDGSQTSDRVQDGKSGAGRDNGDKQAREAEQLAAMGKIADLIGKRSANMTGEVMVEVAPRKEQQLQTQYTEQQATHTGAGSDLNRDEVPLQYQKYVQQYFEEIHKLAESQQKSKKAAGQ